MRLFHRQRTRFTREQSLAAVPVRNASLEIARDDAGIVTVTIPWRPGRWASMVGALMMVPRARRRRVVQLDEVGSYVFDLCDGERPVKTIVDIFAQRYKLSRKEALVSIMTYLGQLARRGIMALMVAGAGGPGRRAHRKDRG